MKNFKIIPVIDILNSKAVHAVKGERNNYKPLKSYLFDSDDPIDIINILHQKYKFSYFYIADLDAIMKQDPNLDFLIKISKISSIKAMIDPGISLYNDILKYVNYNIEYIIVGLETISSIEILSNILNFSTQNKIILSIDMYKEKLLTNIDLFKNQNPLKIIKIIQDLGQKLGGISPLYLDIREIFNGDIYVGGGIKDFEDIDNFYNNKFSGVLLGTALYDGSINIQKLVNF